MRKLMNAPEITLPEGQPGTAARERMVMEQPNCAVIYQRKPGENPWEFLSGYDWAPDHDDWAPNPNEWLPGHS